MDLFYSGAYERYFGKLKYKMSKIVLIGAGSAIFGLGTISDIFNSKILEGSTIMLHDINQKALKKTKSIGNTNSKNNEG